MTISNTSQLLRLRRASLAALATTAITSIGVMTASADTIELSNGDTLTGTITSFDNGLITLRSSLAYQPLEIKATSVSRIAFPEKQGDNPVHTERLILANNDIIPCKVLSMDAQQLHISTWYAGKFSIPRSNIHALQFGLSQERVVFSSTGDSPEWGTRDGNWTIDNGTYISKGSGSIARKLDLPEDVRFNFDFAWKDAPNFAFRFCADNDSPTTRQGTYEFQFNSTGMQILRYQNSTQPVAHIVNGIPLKPRSFNTSTINVDLRVSRTDGMVSLHINGEMIGSWPDAFAKAKGRYIIFNNRSNSKNACVLSNIKISSLSGGALPRHREKAAVGESDILIDSEGQNMSGTITSITQGEDNQRTIIFDAKHSNIALKVPDRRISTLLFAKADAPKFNTTTFSAILKNNGSIQLENPKFVNGKLTSIHPVLGPCTLSPKAISHISQSSAKK